MKTFAHGEVIPAGIVTPRLTPELKARAEQLTEELHAAGFDVVLALNAPKGEQVPTWLLGDAVHLLARLARTAEYLQKQTCTCDTCRKARKEVRA
ncbi:hypothetical protein [Deinococcus marmoris]|uniref:Uncharacterized protein n=1 Tax=Deinococcus marmoris TaxID=249408 RepID=A0A1U7P4Q5_9DEIO|nr:hypothetical protein [Deinococcus marmoris]OLV20153.1 hypothetical protein BOO71_0000487 [Deinococcus marmoris]